MIGKYRCTKKLGAGGMGEVWQAWDAALSRWVALKLLMWGDSEGIARFEREARMAGSLSHPHIAAVYEVGREAGRHFIAMQLVEGTTLRRWEAPDRRAVVALIRDAARAVSYAHDRGMVHRDLKPDNLMVSTVAGAPHVFVMDFGLARAVEGDSSISLTGAIVGTPAYMSPEQAEGKPVDYRADVYSMGATLYDLLTGRPPFAGTSPVEVMKKVTSEEDPPAPRSLDRAVDAELDTVVRKCMDKEPSRRYPSMGALADDLDRYLRGEPILARPPGALTIARAWSRRHRFSLRVLAASLLVVAVSAGGFAGVRWARARLHERASRASLENGRGRLRDGDPQAALREAESGLALARGAPAGESHPVAQLELLRAQARVREGKAEEASRAFAAAFRAGAEAADPAERDASASGLAGLARGAESRSDVGLAASAWTVLLERFPRSPLAPQALLGLARSLESRERLPEALQHYRAALASGGLEAPDAEAARDSVELLAALVPSPPLPQPEGVLFLADVDGDGRAEFVILGSDARVTVYRWKDSRLVRWLSGGPIAGAERKMGHALAADLDGDGRRELITSWGMGTVEVGGVVVWDVRDGSLVERASAPLRSGPTAMLAADLDGEGTVELIVGVGYYDQRLRVYRLRGTTLDFTTDASLTDTKLAAAEQEGAPRAIENEPRAADGSTAFLAGKGTGILSLLAGDFLPEPGLELLVGLGPWNGWRLWLCRWDPATARLVHEARSPLRFRPEHLARADGGVVFAHEDAEGEVKQMKQVLKAKDEDLPLSGAWLCAGSGRSLVTDIRPLQTLPRPGKLAPIHLVRLAGRQAIVARVRDGDLSAVFQVALFPANESASRRVIARDANPQAVGDLDGDGDDEIVLTRESGGTPVFQVFGAEPAPAFVAPVFGGGSGAVGEDLLSLGLLDDAESEFRARNDHEGLGRVAEARGDLRKAAQEYLAVQGFRRADSLLAAATCLERLRDWKGAAEAVRAALHTGRLGTAAHSAALDRSAWLDQTASAEERFRLDSLLDAPRLLAGNPFHSRLKDGALEIWTPVGTRLGLGAWIEYPGGPLAVSWEMCVDEEAFDSGALVGLAGPVELSSSLYLGGGGNTPTCWTGIVGPGVPEAVIPGDAFHPQPGQWFPVRLDYVPSAGRAWVQFGDSAVAGLRLNRPLPPGRYVLGAVPRRDERPPMPDCCRFRLRALRVHGYELALRLADGEPDSARDWVRSGNGEYARGRWEAALEAYGRAAAARSMGDRELEAEIAFLRSMTLRAMGREADAGAELARARKASAEGLEKVLKLSDVGLTEEERSWIQRAGRD
jgi:tetratricopeptide (TPR) repeat protein